MYPLLEKLINVEREEVAALLASAAYFFFVLAAYYVIRPVRDNMGAAGGVNNLSWLYTATIIAMFIVNPLFSLLVAQLGRYRFVSISYRFFALNLLIFYVLMKVLPAADFVWIGRIFYVWTAVFNLFVVSIFWQFMSDLWHTSQSKRLFGFIGVGGTFGGILGSSLTALLATVLGVANLLLLSALLLETALFLVRRLPDPSGDMRVDMELPTGQKAEVHAASIEAERPIGGSPLAGIAHALRSPYMLGIAAYILLYTITTTVIYFQKIDIVARAFTDQNVRTAFFAKVDLAVNVVTVLTQMFLTGRIIKALGVGLTLALLPILSVFGFTGLGFVPTLAVLVVFESLRRAGNYAIARPTRETLYTVLEREDKFKAKAFIDTFIYRLGDALAAWFYPVFGLFGLALSGIAFATVPLAGIWLVIGLWLGGRQKQIAQEKGITVS